MPDVRITLDITGYVEQVDQARNRDIPFVTAKALTRVAQDGQTEMRRQLARKFHLRNTWTQQGIKIKSADKLSWPIGSQVFTDTGNDSAPDYLVLQEDGGAKIHHGSNDFAVPTKYLRKYAPSTIPFPLRPKGLLPVGAAIGTPYRGIFAAPFTGKLSRFGRLGVRKLKQIGTSSYVAFKQYDKHGTLCIFVRLQGQRDAEPWYVLTPRANVRAVLEMVPTIEKIVDERFDVHWDDAWDAIDH